MRRWCLCVVVAALSGGMACGGSTVLVGSADYLVADLPSLMGPEEELAREYLVDMTEILVSAVDTPDDAIDRLAAFLRFNRADMLSNAVSVQRNFDALDGHARRVYEAQFAVFMQDAYDAWLHVLRTYGSRHPEVAARIRTLIDELDR